jgi:AcrR family transcriptional regulator
MTAARSISPRPKAGPGKLNARERILDAAVRVADKRGVGHLSLDAVAKSAGISKGGLLYHFPSKNDLMRALVEHHVGMTEQAISAAEEASTSPNAVATALIRTYIEALECRAAPPTGVLAAFAQNPELLDPVRAYQTRLISNIRASAGNVELSLMAFLVLEGIKAHDIFEFHCLTAKDVKQVLAALAKQLLVEN